MHEKLLQRTQRHIYIPRDSLNTLHLLLDSLLSSNIAIKSCFFLILGPLHLLMVQIQKAKRKTESLNFLYIYPSSLNSHPQSQCLSLGSFFTFQIKASIISQQMLAVLHVFLPVRFSCLSIYLCEQSYPGDCLNFEKQFHCILFQDVILTSLTNWRDTSSSLAVPNHAVGNNPMHRQAHWSTIYL